MVRRCIAAGTTSLVVVFATLVTFANARDLGQWASQNSAMREWFESLMMPDQPTTSCCGAADAYWADDFEMKDGRYVAIVTDTRPDEPLQRAHIAPGTRFVIPDNKITLSPTNPTGHGWVFVMAGIVFCYLPPAGV
jgi:hypothetical protein